MTKMGYPLTNQRLFCPTCHHGGPGFEPRTIHVAFMVDKALLRQLYLRVLRCFSISISTPMFYIYDHYYEQISIMPAR